MAKALGGTAFFLLKLNPFCCKHLALGARV
jgi:hypothetical protein